MINKVSYSHHASYSTLNNISSKTKYIWFVCHGYGQLSRYFIKKFEGLNPDENYVIAPQGLSKFYLDGNYGRVGASWLTKEERTLDLENQLKYLKAVYDQGLKKLDMSKFQLILLGFSQGVATISRFTARHKVLFNRLVLIAGGFPHELTDEDFQYLGNPGEVLTLVGDKDQYYHQAIYEQEISRMKSVFHGKLTHHVFDGKHELTAEIINGVLQND